ncbi:SMC-Scp complex subunit ScpB [Micromonospora sp. URMC 107]|uniref:SMC-Scp complex subunit ScpB n=1 Tax=Micromonospora sp. URMC 107 TaxID=3423418 RepID=UPI003F1E2FA7
MNSDERRDSLADQAAAWVPPWQRPTVPSATPDAEDPGESPPAAAPEPPVPAEPLNPPEPSEPPGPPALPEPPRVPGPAGIPAGPALAEDVVPALAEDVVPALAEDVVPAPAGEGPGGRAPEKAPRARRRAAPAPEPAPELDDAELRGALEAILLVVDEPVSELTLAQVLEQPAERIGPVLDGIAAGYTAAGHGFELRRAAGGWRLYTRPEYATYVERFVLDGQSVRLTQAALETLAVIAYKQPVTRGRISAIRGVNCDGVIRTLVSRGLVEECGTEPDSGAFLYRTTTMFLEKLGLNSVDDLPPLAPFLPDDVEELADATR